MNARLIAELQRLYGLPDRPVKSEVGTLPLVDGAGRVRAMVLALKGPADWAALSPVWRGVQADLELPAPAIAVNGVDAYELWFSLAEPVPLAQATAFLEGLRARYMQAVKPSRVVCCPGESAFTQNAPLIPARQGDVGNWSAFVAPDLAAVFGEEPLLDVAPGFEAQADLLGRLACIKPAAFEAALAQSMPLVQHPTPSTNLADEAHRAGAETYEDPRLFLRDVMNDATAPLALRIEAAKALMQR